MPRGSRDWVPVLAFYDSPRVESSSRDVLDFRLGDVLLVNGRQRRGEEGNGWIPGHHVQMAEPIGLVPERYVADRVSVLRAREACATDGGREPGHAIGPGDLVFALTDASKRGHWVFVRGRGGYVQNIESNPSFDHLGTLQQFLESVEATQLDDRARSEAGYSDASSTASASVRRGHGARRARSRPRRRRHERERDYEDHQQREHHSRSHHGHQHAQAADHYDPRYTSDGAAAGAGYDPHWQQQQQQQQGVPASMDGYSQQQQPLDNPYGREDGRERERGAHDEFRHGDWQQQQQQQQQPIYDDPRSDYYEHQEPASELELDGHRSIGRGAQQRAQYPPAVPHALSSPMSGAPSFGFGVAGYASYDSVSHPVYQDMAASTVSAYYSSRQSGATAGGDMSSHYTSVSGAPMPASSSDGPGRSPYPPAGSAGSDRGLPSAGSYPAAANGGGGGAQRFSASALDTCPVELRSVVLPGEMRTQNAYLRPVVDMEMASASQRTGIEVADGGSDHERDGTREDLSRVAGRELLPIDKKALAAAMRQFGRPHDPDLEGVALSVFEALVGLRWPAFYLIPEHKDDRVLMEPMGCAAISLEVALFVTPCFEWGATNGLTAQRWRLPGVHRDFGLLVPCALPEPKRFPVRFAQAKTGISRLARVHLALQVSDTTSFFVGLADRDLSKCRGKTLKDLLKYGVFVQVLPSMGSAKLVNEGLANHRPEVRRSGGVVEQVSIDADLERQRVVFGLKFAKHDKVSNLAAHLDAQHGYELQDKYWPCVLSTNDQNHLLADWKDVIDRTMELVVRVGTRNRKFQFKELLSKGVLSAQPA